jgi:hypothetical protein
MDMITGYFMAPVRGIEGNDVSRSVKWANIQMALEIADWLKRKFPDVDWYIPHYHEEFIEALQKQGVTSETVVAAFCDIAASKDIAILYDGNGVSNGMISERRARAKTGKCTTSIDTTDDIAREQIAMVILKAMENK